MCHSNPRRGMLKLRASSSANLVMESGRAIPLVSPSIVQVADCFLCSFRISMFCKLLIRAMIDQQPGPAMTTSASQLLWSSPRTTDVNDHCVTLHCAL